MTDAGIFVIDRQSRNRRHKITMNYQPYIILVSAICGGAPVVKGTRVTVRTVLGSLAEARSGTSLRVRHFRWLNMEIIIGLPNTVLLLNF